MLFPHLEYAFKLLYRKLTDDIFGTRNPLQSILSLSYIFTGGYLVFRYGSLSNKNARQVSKGILNHNPLACFGCISLVGGIYYGVSEFYQAFFKSTGFIEDQLLIKELPKILLQKHLGIVPDSPISRSISNRSNDSTSKPRVSDKIKVGNNYDKVKDNHNNAPENDPPTHTDEQIAILNYFHDITVLLRDDLPLRNRIWSMKGQMAPPIKGKEQMTFTSIRYHLAFVSYAVAGVQYRNCPAYVGLTWRILAALLDHLMDIRSWGYGMEYWGASVVDGEVSERDQRVSLDNCSDETIRDNPLYPFNCSENIMWWGHVLEVIGFLEILTGDLSFTKGRKRLRAILPRVSGSLENMNIVRTEEEKQLREKWIQFLGRTNQNHPSDVNSKDSRDLDFANHPGLSTSVEVWADKLAESMLNHSASGGLPCEPGLVFFHCQNHAQIGMKLLEMSGKAFGDIQLEGRREGAEGSQGEGWVGQGGLGISDMKMKCLGSELEPESNKESRNTKQKLSSSSSSQAINSERQEDLFAHTRTKWETHALTNYKARYQTGAFSTVKDEESRKGGIVLPFGHLGSDGWCLTHYFMWSGSARFPRDIYWKFTRKVADEIVPGLGDGMGVDDGKTEAGEQIGTGQDKVKNRDVSCCGTNKKSKTVSNGPLSCCLPLAIPDCAWMSFLFPAAAQAGDLDITKRLKHQLKERFYHHKTISTTEEDRVKEQVSDNSENGLPDFLPPHCARLEEGIEWSIGATAHFLLGTVAEQDSGSLRDMVQNPFCLQDSDYFIKPVLVDARLVNVGGKDSLLTQHLNGDRVEVLSCHRYDLNHGGEGVEGWELRIVLRVPNNEDERQTDISKGAGERRMSASSVGSSASSTSTLASVNIELELGNIYPGQKVKIGKVIGNGKVMEGVEVPGAGGSKISKNVVANLSLVPGRKTRVEIDILDVLGAVRERSTRRTVGDRNLLNGI